MDHDLTTMTEAELLAVASELDAQRATLRDQLKAIGDELRDRAEAEQFRARFGPISPADAARLLAVAERETALQIAGMDGGTGR